MRLWAGILLCLLALRPAAAEEAASSTPPPFELVRSLQSLQDKIGMGNKAMQEARPALMNRVAENFKAAPDRVWQDIRNQRAARLYLLNGGDRNLVRMLYAKGVMVNADAALFEGALAYVSGDLEKARQAWQKLDIFSLPASLGSHVAFAQAALCVKSNPAQAVKWLDTARVLAPGTLIEEAALRRELTLLQGDENADAFLWLAANYMQRFDRSLYSDEVRKRLVHVAPALLSSAKYENRVINLLVHLPDVDAMSVYLMAAGVAVTHNHVAQAENWAGIVLAMPGVVGVEKSRAWLYRAAARLDRLDYAAARAALAEAEPRFLIGPDAQLLQAVQAILNLNPAPLKADAPAEPLKSDPAPEKLIETVQALLAGTDRLLSEHKP